MLSSFLQPTPCWPTMQTEEPNVSAAWSSLMHHIQEILSSNIDPETCYPDRFFAIFHNPSRQMPDSTLKQDTAFSSLILFQFIFY
jgi:hypothetical protein